MADGDTPIALGGEFPSVELAAWESLAGDVEALRTTTYDGITIEPLYTSADAAPEPGLPGFAPFVRGRTAPGTRSNGWDVRQVVDAGRGRGAAVTELERGATSVLLQLGDEAAYDIDDLLVARVLEGVLFDVAPVVLDAGQRWLQAANALEQVWKRQDADPTTVGGSFGADPLGEWASDRGGVDIEGHLADFDGWAFGLPERFPNMRLSTIDGTRFHDAGASDAQELGYTVATAVATLRLLTDETSRLDIANAFGQLELRLAATADQFATIAKFRAARRVWARVAEIARLPRAAGRTPLHAISSTAMMTRYDPAVNMLRATVACFAAGIAGADAVTVLPYDHVSSATGSDLGRRLARNTQSVLAMESNLAQVIDPAGGSWYVECLTHELARAAWACFQEVEAAGGFRAAVEAGLVNERIATVRDARDRDIDHRRSAFTGVSEFPNIAEPSPPPAGALKQPDDGSLPQHRWAGGFELLRQRVDGVVASATRPSILLATLGTPAAFTARAMFAKNFFEVAGVEARFGPATDDIARIVDAFESGSTRVACICSNDATYAEHGATMAKALVAAGATRVYVAGEPRDHIDALTHAGVTHAITASSDARAVLADLLDHLEIA